MKFHRTRTLLRWLLGLGFVAAGLNHFIVPRFYLPIMPPFLPWPLALIYVSGVAEILGGLGVLVPSARKLAGWGLILLLVAVFPANLYAAFHGVGSIPPWILWVRLPFQCVFIAWVYWTCLSSYPTRPAEWSRSRQLGIARTKLRAWPGCRRERGTTEKARTAK